MSRKFRHMDRGKIGGIIEALSSSGIKQVTYSGGEPTLYPHLDFAIKEAKEQGLIVHVNTNGYLLTRSLAEKWKGLGVTQVQINIDSINPAKHDEIRGREGSFVKALKALGNAKNAGITAVSQTVLTRENENEILDILKMARKAGMERCRIWDMMLSGNAEDKESLVPERYMDILKEVSEFARMTGAASVEAGEPLFPLDYDTKLKVIDSFCVCLAGLLANFSVEGDAYFCCMHRKPLYNVFRDLDGTTLEELHSSRLNEFSKSIKLPGKCGSCSFLERCHGGCIARTGYTKDGRDYWCRV